MYRRTETVLAGFSRKAKTALDRNLFSPRSDTDTPAEEQVELTGDAHPEGSGVLQKKGPLLREKKIEAIEIDLLHIRFDLGEIGIDGSHRALGSE